MMQEEIDFDSPHCRECGVTLIRKVNWFKRENDRLCRDCNKIHRDILKSKYKEIHSDPNKVWDPEYLKTCHSCKKTQKAEESRLVKNNLPRNPV